MSNTPATKPKKLVKSNAGRLLFDGKSYDIVIQKLEEVWAIGGSDAEAAFYAGISKAALSDFINKRPEISERKQSLQEKPVLKARQTIVRNLDQVQTSQWYLERKRPQEFGGAKVGVAVQVNIGKDREEFVAENALS